MQKSQHITVIGTVIILRYRAIHSFRVFNARPILLVKTPVLPYQEHTQTQSKECSKEHKSSTDCHALYIPGGLFIREDIGTQERPTLADQVQQDNTSTTAGIGALVVCTMYNVTHPVSKTPLRKKKTLIRKGNDSLRTHGRILAIEGKIPQAAKNTPKYRIPTDVQVAQRMYPTPPTSDKPAIINPRC
jgi:hypothetical protein